MGRRCEEIVIYLVDHGYEENGTGRFRINSGPSEVLTAPQLDAWLDTLQSVPGKKITVVIDCCNSGAFLPYLTPPSGADRIAITSCRRIN